MDNNTILGISGVVISVAGIVYTAVNHKRVRSNCCGKVLEVSLDIDATTPNTKPTALVNGTS